MSGQSIKARRPTSAAGPKSVSVSQGMHWYACVADVNGERWCRVTDVQGRTAKILMHPSMLHDEAATICLSVNHQVECKCATCNEARRALAKWIPPKDRKGGEAGGRIPCQGCGIPIPQPGENPDQAALLCDTCYDTLPDPAPRVVAECRTCRDSNGVWADLNNVECAEHRAAGHDVRPVAQTEGRGCNPCDDTYAECDEPNHQPHEH